MATCNGGRFLSEQLRSIANQVCLPAELIISDDASTDDTIEIAEEFLRSAPFPVKIIQNQQRLGYGNNFIGATKQATGCYIAYCDQDDIWLPDKLQSALEAIEESGADLYVHGAILVDAAGTATGVFTQGIRKRSLQKPLSLPPWGVFYGFSMVFRREIFYLIDADDRGGHTFEWVGSLSHDLWIYFIAASIGHVVVDPRPLVMYRRHDRNETPSLHGNFLRKISKYLGLAAHKNLRRDAIALHRSKILMNFFESSNSSRLRINAEKASQYWKAIAHFEAKRIEIYTQNGALTRLSLCLKLLWVGGYRSYQRGGLSWRLFVKDILFGVAKFRRPVVSS
ncbi:glycosyltransferase [Methylobacterium brachiatum]|uniref:Glycosyltransferase n=2 Tax=Methylobacterium brachiatum TaxID=269660 RepID=A0ABV1R6R4_9HYPH